MKALILFLSSLVLFPSFGGGDKKKTEDQDQIQLTTDEDPKADYYKYEKEEVHQYRKHIDFNMPEVVPAMTVTEVDESVNIDPYFQNGTRTYIDADGRLGYITLLHQEEGAKTETVRGYRIQIYAGIERANANKVKSEFIQNVGGMSSYLKHIAPTYRVRVGDFLSRDDAVTYLSKVKEYFPGAFIVPDDVYIPRYKPVDEGGDEDEVVVPKE